MSKVLSTIALVSLANRLDVLLSMQDDEAKHEAFQSPEFAFLKLGDEQRWAVLEAARNAFSTAGQPA